MAAIPLAQDVLAEVSVEAENPDRDQHRLAQGRYMESRFNAATEGHERNPAAAAARPDERTSFFCVLGDLFHSLVGGKDLLSVMSAKISLPCFYAAPVASSVGRCRTWPVNCSGRLVAELIAVLLAEVSTITTPKEPKPLPRGPLGVQFRGVDFSYPTRPDLPALTGIDLAIEPSERVALVGPSGAGKSTMLGLILRLFDPVAGQVMIGGIDARSVAIEDLRVMGLVPRKPPVFRHDHDNIRFGRPDADHAALREAATVPMPKLIRICPRAMIADW